MTVAVCTGWGRLAWACGGGWTVAVATGLALLASSAAAQNLPAGAQAGDLIFRLGTERISQMVQAVDQGRFSHVGLLVGAPGQWQVLHATPSERPGQPDAVVLDPLAFFLAPERAQTHAVYQVQGASAQRRQQVVQWALSQQGRPFQMLESQEGVYCTTLVWQAWQQAGLDLEVRFTSVMLPVIGGNFLLPSALQASRHVQLLPAPAVRTITPPP